MKRLAFYGILLLQAAVILIIPLQYQLIDAYGETIKIAQAKPDPELDYGYEADFSYPNLYVEYEMNKINKDLWKDEKPKKSGTRVYVLLEKQADGLFTVVEASTKKLVKEKDQMLLIGQYQHDYEGIYIVNYGIENINNYQDKYSNLNSKERLAVTIKVAPWNQYKIITVENIKQ